jgi:hypothetical protein
LVEPTLEVPLFPVERLDDLDVSGESVPGELAVPYLEDPEESVPCELAVPYLEDPEESVPRDLVEPTLEVPLVPVERLDDLGVSGESVPCELAELY